MNSKTETIADILAEMRGAWGAATPTAEDLAIYADRIEAAAARERTAHINDIHDALYAATRLPGNAAAMRGALMEIVLLTVKAGKSIPSDVACGIIASKAKHALAPAEGGAG